MTPPDSTRADYELIRESPLSTIEMIDLVYGDRDVVYGTLFVTSHDDLDSQLTPIADLELEFGLNPSRASLESETDDWSGEEKQASIAVGTDRDVVNEFLHHEKNSNHSEVGDLLGYPECCIEAFESHFEEKSATWTGSEIAAHVLNTTPQFTTAPFYTNRFLRYEHPALLYHFPCHPNCEKSIEIGERRYDLLRELDVVKAEEIERVLSSAVIYRVTRDGESDDILDVTDVMYCPEYTYDEETKRLTIDGEWTSGRPGIGGDFFDYVRNETEMTATVTDFRDSLSEVPGGAEKDSRIVLFHAEC